MGDLRETHLQLTHENFDYEYQRRNFHIDMTTVSCNREFEKTLVYLNTIVNYSIWRYRNDIRYKQERPRDGNIVCMYVFLLFSKTK